MVKLHASEAVATPHLLVGNCMAGDDQVVAVGTPDGNNYVTYWLDLTTRGRLEWAKVELEPLTPFWSSGRSVRMIYMYDKLPEKHTAIKDEILKWSMGTSVGFNYNKQGYVILRRPDNLSGIYTGSMPWEEVPTRGTPPRYASGFSATHINETIYLTSGGDNSIHHLQLKTMTWGSEEISGFVGASSGCLVLYNRTLIHAFGKVGEAYNNSTKIVSIDDWKLLYPKQLPFQSAYCPYGGCLKKIVAEHYFLKTKPLNNKPLSTISNASVKQVPKVNDVYKEHETRGKLKSTASQTEPDPPFAPLPTSPSPSPIHTIVQTPNANFPPELVYTLIATLLVIFLLFISTIAYICIKRTTKASIYPPPPPSPIHQLLWADSPVKLTLDTKYELQPEESFDLNQSYISFPAQRL